MRQKKLIIIIAEKKYRNFEEIRTALEDGKVDGALIDTYVAAEHKGELFSDSIFVKEILDRPFGYGVVLSGAAVNVEQRCRDYISMQISEIFHIIQNTTETLDVSLCLVNISFVLLQLSIKMITYIRLTLWTLFMWVIKW